MANPGTALPPASAAGRGDWRRWVPTTSMLLVSLISYIDRNTLALLAPTILRETNLTGEQYGFIISAFSICYMVSNPVWGRILDRVGLRAGMAAAVFFWTLASMSHALASGFASFAAARAALGFGEGATFPGGLRAVMQTLPASERGRGVAVAYSGGSLGAIVTPLVITPVFLWWGWRAAFLFTGLIGIAWLALWAVVSRRPDVRRAPAPKSAQVAAPRFTDPRLWSFISAYALGALPLGFVLYGASIYLGQAMGASQAFIGKVLWIPPLGWEVGYFVWGWLSDRMFRAAGSRVFVLRRLMFAALLMILPFAAVPWIGGVWGVLLLMFLAMFVAAGFVILSLAYATEVYSADHAGFIAGVGAGSWGAAVAICMPVFGRLFDQHRYDVAFLLATVIPVAGYLGWLWLHRREPAAVG
jgi:ACS family hexuronate transporter-like MFS transporter